MTTEGGIKAGGTAEGLAANIAAALGIDVEGGSYEGAWNKELQGY